MRCSLAPSEACLEDKLIRAEGAPEVETGQREKAAPARESTRVRLSRHLQYSIKAKSKAASSLASSMIDDKLTTAPDTVQQAKCGPASERYAS